MWQAWHKLTSTVLSRGRRGTFSHLPSFCVAGVALMALGGALGLGLGARDARDAAPLLRGRRGTWWHPPWFHVSQAAPLAKRLRQRFYEMLQCNVQLGKWTLSEFRADESTSTYYLHVLVSSDAQRMTLRAKLLYDPVYLRVPLVEDGKVCPWNKPAFSCWWVYVNLLPSRVSVFRCPENDFTCQVAAWSSLSSCACGGRRQSLSME